MRAVVIGAGGLLGRHLCDELAERGHDVQGRDRAACPIEDERAVRAAVAGAEWVFNAAAWTDVDGAEREPERAFSANALGAENVARAASAASAVVVHVSTDFVFAGTLARPHDEFDRPDPQSIYARSKRAGELLVERAAPRHHIVRVQGLYGTSGRNFASRLPSLLQGGGRLRIDGERQVQPTSARAAARAMVEIAGSDRFGTWHAVCRGATTWHDFALRVAERLGVTPSWEAVPSGELALPAPRPPNCRLENRRMAMCGLAPMPTWEEAQDEWLLSLAPVARKAQSNQPL
ncbi:MAG: NAD-dependent epimerase/dehydratase family protein [Myxococcales bacterium]|nr:NAD-dependent epimerase/dehydratase family protein [Myxococcales bacterium]